MDVTQLKTLIHVAELGSLSKAADRLHVAQPALSRQVRLLEQELGVTLFERHGRGMVVTDVGRDILEHASRILAEMEAIRNVAAGTGKELAGTATIGTTPTVAEIITVPLVRELRERHPRLNLRLASAFSGHLLDWLQRGELELAVSYDPPPMRSLRIVPVMLEELLLVQAAPAGLQPDPLPFASLADMELVLPSSRHGLRAIVEDCALRAGVSLKAGVEADSFGAMIDLVRNGFGATLLPLAPIYALVQSGALGATPVIDPVPTRKLVLAYPSDRPVARATRLVAETFVSIAADLVERRVWAGRMLADPPADKP
ncbi:LysR substrate-binding domain-containing protein [Aureimonas altamirensis]|uniref:LysR substrate-binding domain-containing protein n=1 Tax=Aureimonas altamirensis TaxID=370622 RepID=UPI0020369AA2|nr:LysR substrate-binding domain-containing protein [Aureimonas altamirensis]MCM2505941.1 LysR substrate-binding domain-containing protein [Aureimonas altamirensis]